MGASGNGGASEDRPIQDALSGLEDDMESQLERLADGTLSREERTELERAAEGDPSLAARLEAYSPLGNSAFDRITDEALMRREPARPRRIGWWGAGAGLALAAGLAAVVVLRGPSWDGARLEVLGPRVLEPDSQVTLTLVGAPPGKVRLWARAGGEARPVDYPWSATEDGGWTVTAAARDLTSGIYGHVELRAWVGPTDAEAVATERAGPGRVLVHRVRLRPPQLAMRVEARGPRTERGDPTPDVGPKTVVLTPRTDINEGVSVRAFSMKGDLLVPVEVSEGPPWRIEAPEDADALSVWLGPTTEQPPADPKSPGLWRHEIVVLR